MQTFAPLGICLFAIVLLAAGVGVSVWALAQASRDAAERRRAADLARWQYAEQMRLAALARLRTLNGLLALSPTDFEHAVAGMLAWYGYRNVNRTGGAGDLAADLTCIAPDGRATVVQCKRYAPDHSVNSPTIQTFIGMVTVHHRAQLGLFVTTSSYTQPAIDLARRHPYIQLWSGDELVGMMQRYVDQSAAAARPAPNVGPQTTSR